MKFDAIGDLINLEYMAKQCRLSVVEQQGKRHNLIRALIDWRLDARKNRDYNTSDKIRLMLEAQGVTIIDSKLGFGDCVTDTYIEGEKPEFEYQPTAWIAGKVIHQFPEMAAGFEPLYKKVKHN